MTVYVIQEPHLVRDKSTGRSVPRDMTSATQYGALVYVLSTQDSPSNLPAPTLHKMMRGLKDFDPTSDYLLSAGGDPLGPVLAGQAMAQLNMKEYQFLRWDRIRGDRAGGAYVPITVPGRT